MSRFERLKAKGQGLMARFRAEESGNVLMFFAFAMIPAIGIVGAAIDYGRASNARSQLHAAIDSAALMAARDAAKLTDAQLQTRVDGWIRANLSSSVVSAFKGSTLAIDRTARTVSVRANLDVQTTVAQVLGRDTIRVSSNSQSTWGTNTIELALALDNTGSMASSGKMTALKAASLDLINIMKEATNAPDQIKISIVPFATQVRLDASKYKDEPWLRWDMTRTVTSGRTTTTETMNKTTWSQSGQGCITDRDQSYDTTDGEAAIDTTAKRYPPFWCAVTSLATIQPLTADWTALQNKVNSMTPTGNTNVTIGAIWGAATLSPGVPFTEAKPFATPRLSKYMILLTDGDNTQNRWSTNSSTIDARTALACTNIKSYGIKIYTIRVIDGDAALLKACASDPSMYYDVKNASQLSPVFKAIASEISQVRLTQ